MSWTWLSVVATFLCQRSRCPKSMPTLIGPMYLLIWQGWTIIFFISHSGGGVQTGSTRHVGHFCPLVPAPGYCEDGEFGGIKIGRGNRSTRRKPAPAPLCSPQIPLDETRAPTRTLAAGSQRLTAWAMARPQEWTIAKAVSGGIFTAEGWFNPRLIY
jgi:hypothetical protein